MTRYKELLFLLCKCFGSSPTPVEAHEAIFFFSSVLSSGSVLYYFHIGMFHPKAASVGTQLAYHLYLDNWCKTPVKFKKVAFIMCKCFYRRIFFSKSAKH